MGYGFTIKEDKLKSHFGAYRHRLRPPIHLTWVHTNRDIDSVHTHVYQAYRTKNQTGVQSREAERIRGELLVCWMFSHRQGERHTCVLINNNSFLLAEVTSTTFLMWWLDNLRVAIVLLEFSLPTSVCFILFIVCVCFVVAVVVVFYFDYDLKWRVTSPTLEHVGEQFSFCLKKYL